MSSANIDPATTVQCYVLYQRYKQRGGCFLEDKAAGLWTENVSV